MKAEESLQQIFDKYQIGKVSEKITPTHEGIIHVAMQSHAIEFAEWKDRECIRVLQPDGEIKWMIASSGETTMYNMQELYTIFNKNKEV